MNCIRFDLLLHVAQLNDEDLDLFFIGPNFNIHSKAEPFRIHGIKSMHNNGNKLFCGFLKFIRIYPVEKKMEFVLTTQTVVCDLCKTGYISFETDEKLYVWK